MQARTILVWSLTPLILLFGLYLETKDRPAEPVRAIAQVPGSTFTPAPEVAAEPVVEAPAPPPEKPDRWDYWEYNEMWDDKRDELTKLHFEEWERSQAGTKILVAGTLDEIKAPGWNGECQTHIEAHGVHVGYRGFWTHLACDAIGKFNKGDDIVLHCVMGDDGIISPDVEECEIQ